MKTHLLKRVRDTTTRRRAAALMVPLDDPPPSPSLRLPHFCLSPSEEEVPLSGRSTETSQSEGRCHNKQKRHSKPPKSNQEPLIHALNGDWVPWEWLIHWGHRQHDRGLYNSAGCIGPYHSVLTFRLDAIYQLKDDTIITPNILGLFISLIHLCASINDSFSCDLMCGVLFWSVD